MSGLPSLYLEVRGRERSVNVEAPGLPMILRKSEMAAERCAVGWSKARTTMVSAVTLTPGSPELLPLSFLPWPSTFNYQLSPSVCWDNSVPPGACLQCFPVRTPAQHRWAQTRQIWRAREEMSVIIAQTSSVCESGGQTIFTEALTFRDLPQCYI